MYKENNLVRIAKRENNMIRKYLVVNPLQGKHIPVLPSKALGMFHELGKLIKSNYAGERLLLIGFAETATAIGAAIATQIGGYYMQTTRETIDKVGYLYFSESHSHATEQKLVKEDMTSIISRIDRIIFIEDELTTGNTIMNSIKLLTVEYTARLKFSAASLLNGMDMESEAVYHKYGIQMHYLVKISHDCYESKIERTKGNGSYHVIDSTACQGAYKELVCGGYLNARRVVLGKDYKKACENLWLQVTGAIDFTGYHKLLVLGTEEFMYPALYVAKQIEDLGNQVRFHATTRSPIIVSREENYPLLTRYELASLYDKDRVTFLYDIEMYDLVLVISDSPCKDLDGVNGIMNVLSRNGNSNIYYIRWCQR